MTSTRSCRESRPQAGRRPANRKHSRKVRTPVSASFTSAIPKGPPSSSCRCRLLSEFGVGRWTLDVGRLPLPMATTFSPDEDFALQLDAEDPLRSFRDKFHLPLGENGRPLIYFAGN